MWLVRIRLVSQGPEAIYQLKSLSHQATDYLAINLVSSMALPQLLPESAQMCPRTSQLRSDDLFERSAFVLLGLPSRPQNLLCPSPCRLLTWWPWIAATRVLSPVLRSYIH